MMWLGMLQGLKILDPTKIRLTNKSGDEKTLREIYTPQGFKEGGLFLRGKITKPIGSFTEGLIGKGAYAYGTGKQGWLPDLWGEKPTGKGIIDEAVGKSGGNGLVNITLPEIPKIVIPEFPKIVIPEAGLVQIPKVDMPFGDVQLPSLAPFDDEGAPNYLVLGGLALVAYKVLTGRKG